MRIIIDYEASWRNSFLDGSNDEPIPEKGRNFVASMKELKEAKNYFPREVTKNTVMGILSRLIGDQRKLYYARQSGQYYFADIESLIEFEDKPKIINQEITYIRNIKGNTDRNSFSGMIKANSPIFLSDYSAEFWGVLSLDIEQLCEFILDEKLVSDFQTDQTLALDPVSILDRLENLGKAKPMENSDIIKTACEQLSQIFDKYKPLNAKGQVLVLSMYCSALYLQLQRLEKHFDMQTAKSKMGGISGISNNGVTPKDFMKAYTTGSGKLIYGNPYMREEFVKGEGKILHKLSKASGQLEITLNIDLDKAQDLLQKIEYAGVSSFYLGKKGLAYVSDIRLR